MSHDSSSSSDNEKKTMSFRASRPHGRAVDALRPVKISLSPLDFAEGSAMIECGKTRVLAAATIERRVPRFRQDSGLGWVTGEYSMLPRATHTRSQRESTRGKVSGRTSEIQRLIGRSLRAVVDMSKIPDRTIIVDCDVLQADGGTRTASITAGYVALVQALARVYLEGDISTWPLLDSIAAVSVGLVEDVALLDLEYVEDSAAQVDLNVVATGSGSLVEIQGTGERRGFYRSELDQLLDLADIGLDALRNAQSEVLAPVMESIEQKQAGGTKRLPQPKDVKDLWGRPEV